MDAVAIEKGACRSPSTKIDTLLIIWLVSDQDYYFETFAPTSFFVIHYNINAASGLIRGSLNKFPDLFCMGTFIDSTHRKL